VSLRFRSRETASRRLSPAEPERWGTAMALYMIGFISYGATLVFYAAAFPRLARNTPYVPTSLPLYFCLTIEHDRHARALLEEYHAGKISFEEYELEESLEKNRISNISTVRASYFLLHQLSLSDVVDIYRCIVTSVTSSLSR
jgi:hypothetical protein